MFKAYIFDFDGVIKESVRVKEKAFVELFKHESSSFQKRVADYHLENGGVSRYEKFKVWNNWLGVENTDSRLKEQASKFAGIVVDNVVSAPYVEGAVDALAKASGAAKTFVATGTPDDEIKSILARLNLQNLFTEVHGSSCSKVILLEIF